MFFTNVQSAQLVSDTESNLGSRELKSTENLEPNTRTTGWKNATFMTKYKLCQKIKCQSKTMTTVEVLIVIYTLIG